MRSSILIALNDTRQY